jgi:hypothetical protein
VATVQQGLARIASWSARRYDLVRCLRSVQPFGLAAPIDGRAIPMGGDAAPSEVFGGQISASPCWRRSDQLAIFVLPTLLRDLCLPHDAWGVCGAGREPL